MRQELGPLQTKWVELLESGDYEQCTGQLTKGDAYCCLGIAEFILFSRTTGFNRVSLSVEVTNRIKIRSERGHAKDITMPALYSLNDSYKKTFEEIAQVIRENPEQYFTAPA